MTLVMILIDYCGNAVLFKSINMLYILSQERNMHANYSSSEVSHGQWCFLQSKIMSSQANISPGLGTKHFSANIGFFLLYFMVF